MRDGFLIDGKGRVWSDASSDLARRIGCMDTGADLASFAVRERGFVHIRPHEDGVRVTLREDRFNYTAFAGTMLALGRMKPSRILLSVLGDGPSKFRIFLDFHDFCAEVEPLATGSPIEVRVPRLSERRNRRVLNLPTFASTRPIVDLWESTHGELTEEVHLAVAASGLFRRTVLVRQLSPHRLITEYMGTAIQIFRPCEALLKIGRDLDDMADREYGAWVAEAYAETLWSSSLRVDSLRAVVRTGAATTLRTRYDRVLIPWRSRGSSFAMGVSIRREVPTEVP